MGAMAVDHLAYVLFLCGDLGGPLYTACRAIGRVAFPVFAFLIPNGLEHSSDRKRYFTRLTLSALISQLPFSLAFTGSNYFSPTLSGGFSLSFALPGSGSLSLAAAALLGTALLYKSPAALIPAAALLTPFCSLGFGSLSLLGPSANVFYTLGLGMGLLWLIDEAAERPRGREAMRLFLPAVSWLAAAKLLYPVIDYGREGLALIVGLGLCRRQRAVQAALLILWSGFYYLNDSAMNFVGALMALLPILLYNGERGRPVKLGFYAFYPAHLLILAVLGMLL